MTITWVHACLAGSIDASSNTVSAQTTHHLVQTLTAAEVMSRAQQGGVWCGWFRNCSG